MNKKTIDISLLEKNSRYIPFEFNEETTIKPEQWKTYAAYTAMMYRHYKIWMQPFSHIDLATNRLPIYFHYSNYIPYLSNQKYRIEVAQGIHLVDYLKAVEIGHYIVISVKDEGSQQLTEAVVQNFVDIGLRQITREHLRYSYIWIARKRDMLSYEIVYEACSEEELLWKGYLGGKHAIIKSGGALSSNHSSIQLDNQEFSANQRGFNIVSYDPKAEIVECVNYDTFTTLYPQGSLFKAIPPVVQSSELLAVSHAGGEIEGMTYTNCKEAFEQNYIKRQHRVFEVDLELTSDGELVARHDWDAYLYRFFAQLPPEGIQDGEPLTLEQFKSLKIKGKYTPVSITDLFQFLLTHPDAYLITDTKYTQTEIVEKQFSKLVEAAAPFGYNLLMRVIPQIYSEDMYPTIEKIFPFPRYVYTLYKTKASDKEVIDFVKQNGISFVTTYPERYSAAFGKELKKCGTSVFLHTINESHAVREYIRMNVDGFYTDRLSVMDIKEEVIKYQAELDIRRQVLIEFMVERFQAPIDGMKRLLERMDLTELDEISKLIYRAQTKEEFVMIEKRYRAF